MIYKRERFNTVPSNSTIKENIKLVAESILAVGVLWLMAIVVLA